MKAKLLTASIMAAVAFTASAVTVSAKDARIIKGNMERELSRARSALVGINVAKDEAASKLTDARRKIETAKTNVLTKALANPSSQVLFDMSTKIAEDTVCQGARDVAADNLLAAALILQEAKGEEAEKAKAAMSTALVRIAQADKKRVEIWGAGQ